MSNKITILGCGPSGGVPLIGCQCTVCTSKNSKNKRLRASIFWEAGPLKLLIDTGPDLRQQVLANNVLDINAILYTHAHADHTHGLDDVRSFNYRLGKALPVYADKETLQELQERFAYAFLPPMPERGWFRPALEPREVNAGPTEVLNINGTDVMVFDQGHGKIRSLGVRIGNMAYSTDCNYLPESSLEALRGVDTWIVDCLGPHEVPTHAHLDMTLDWIAFVKPRLAVLTHMSHGLDYEKLQKELPKGVVAAFDRMVLEENK